MSKYIVDTDDFEHLFKVDSIGVMGIGKSLSDEEKDHSWSRFKDVGEFEELTAEYVNEHFGELQDEAYRRGLEDGKDSTEKGCEGCKYESVKEGEPPCRACSKAYKNRYTPAPHSDRIEVGDWVYDDSDTPNSWAVVTWADGNDACVMCKDGSTAEKKTHELRKTGRHFDIASILEAMRQ